MMRDFEDVPRKAMVVAVGASNSNDLIPAVRHGIGGDEKPRVAASGVDRGLHDQAIVIAIQQAIFDAFSERGMNKEFNPVCGEADVGNDLTSVRDEVLVVVEVFSLLFDPLFQMPRARKNSNADLVPKPMPGFLSDDSRIILRTFFNKERGRNPEVREFDALIVLVFSGILEPKSLRDFTDVIVVAMRHSQNVDRFVLRPSDVLFEVCPERHPVIVAIRRIVHVSVVEHEQLAGIGFDQAAVSVPQGIESDFSHMLWLVWQLNDLGGVIASRSQTRASRCFKT